MRKTWRLWTAAALLAPMGAGASELAPVKRQDLAADAAVFQAMAAIRPVYSLVEGFSDGIFDVMRLSLFSPFLTSIGADLRRYKQTDSYAIFREEFKRKETHLLQNLYDRRDHSWSRDEQMSVLVDSFKDTMLSRYHVDRLSQWAGDYASDWRNWNPVALGAAGAVGGSFLFLNGLHTQTSIGSAKVNFDFKSGARIRRAMQNGASVAHATGAELRWGAQPIALTSDWAVSNGKFLRDTYGLKYRLQF